MPISAHYFSSSRCLPIFILVGKVVLLVCIRSALIMSFPARTVNKTPVKGQMQRFYKLVSYERAVEILKNDICIAEIGQAVLEIPEFKVKFPRKIPKTRNFANVIIIRVEQ